MDEFRRLSIEELRNIDYDDVLRLLKSFNEQDIEKLSYANFDFMGNAYTGKSLLLCAMKYDNVRLAKWIIQRSLSHDLKLFITNIFIWNRVESEEMTYIILDLWEKYSITSTSNDICDCSKNKRSPMCDMCGPYNRAFRNENWRVAKGIVQFNIGRLKRNRGLWPIAIEIVNNKYYTPLDHLLSKCYDHIIQNEECRELLRTLVKYENLLFSKIRRNTRYRQKYIRNGVYIRKNSMYYAITRNAYPETIDLVSIFLGLGYQLTVEDFLCTIEFGSSDDFLKLVSFANGEIFSRISKDNLYYAASRVKKTYIKDILLKLMVNKTPTDSNITLFSIIELHIQLQDIRNSIKMNFS